MATENFKDGDYVTDGTNLYAILSYEGGWMYTAWDIKKEKNVLLISKKLRPFWLQRGTKISCNSEKFFVRSLYWSASVSEYYLELAVLSSGKNAEITYRPLDRVTKLFTHYLKQ